MKHPKIDRVRHLPLEPSEYCDRWVIRDPARNYRKMCIHAIAEVTGLSPHTIKDWGKNFHRRPKYVTRLLRYADILNQFQQQVKDGTIRIPDDFPT
ncbi:MAG: hypothetical protein F6K03_14600 [Kamptonema sp. SIO4C4]|nr:hypothetical protein [Kamptonema sp. SIO4C4]